MRKFLPLLIALVALACSFAAEADAKHFHAAAPAKRAEGVRIDCGQPMTLRLRRFEDGSAWLLCGPRVLARISVPG